MSDPKGFFLYVNLSAANTRRRLKSFGHGVRKIQSAGKDRACVIHTATGKSFEELQKKFTDVGCASREIDLWPPPRPSDDLSGSPPHSP